MLDTQVRRRHFLQGAGAMAAALTLPLERVFAQAADELPKIALPPPITSAERLARLAKARSLMAKHDIGAIIVVPRPRPDHLTCT